MSDDKNYFIELNGVKHRLLVIEYGKGKPVSVTTEEHWVHRNGDSGKSNRYFDFNFSKRNDRLYWHNSGGGSGNREHNLGKRRYGLRQI